VLPAAVGRLSLADSAAKLTQDSFCLQLLCEACGKPQGEGYSVTKPKDWVSRMLPAMQVGGQEETMPMQGVLIGQLSDINNHGMIVLTCRLHEAPGC
jgi:hypothetical protein